MISKADSIALLGTSADPPTHGHQALLKGLTKLFPKVITWASNNPAKQHGIPLHKRSHLLKILVEKIEDPKIEIIQKLSRPSTIKTLTIANKLWPNSN